MPRFMCPHSTPCTWKKPRGLYENFWNFHWHIEARNGGQHSTNNIFKCTFCNENVWILTEMSLHFVPKHPSDNIAALVQIMVWRHPGDKPLSEPMMVSLPKHICIIGPQEVKTPINVKQNLTYSFLLIKSLLESASKSLGSFFTLDILTDMREPIVKIIWSWNLICVTGFSILVLRWKLPEPMVAYQAPLFL